MQKIALCLSLMLSACTMGNDSFSTEPGQGFGWKSVSKTHEKIQEQEHQSEIKKVKTQDILTHTNYTEEGVGRTSDQFVRVWFAPSQDKYGNFHEARAIQTLLKSGQWSINQEYLS